MIHFQDWLQIREMSASGRRKRQAALGLAPPVADIFSRSTPAPWEVENLTKALNKSNKKKKKRKKIVEAKKSQPIVHKDIDSFIRSVELLVKDVWELDLLKKKKATQDKMDQTTKRNTGSKPEAEKSVGKPGKPGKPEKPEKPEELEDELIEKDRNERKSKIGRSKPEPKVALPRKRVSTNRSGPSRRPQDKSKPKEKGRSDLT